MTVQKLLPQLPQGLNSLSNGLIAVAVIYGLYLAQKAYRAGDKLAESATAPAGEALSDVTAWFNGNHRVELTPLVIQPHYLNAQYQISSEAWEILTRDANYAALMIVLFNNQILKPQYRHLVGQPITQGDL
ncbi:hypothetical protein G3R49_19745 [Shewanella sp. WXL01]|uniref:hypothetical protein n=1 Tax=Shewanella sp. WXL01 TaxID=2709721 RepID=UPI0014382E23|nr:hypothetical protein [Shewanella sp. WXL01]NKF52794.1 hypothetical protein [Shewanella sp. WXL01]